MKTKIIPFDAKVAQDIQNGKIKGRIRTKEGDMDVRIISFDKVKLVHGDGATEKQLVSLTHNPNAREDVLYVHNDKGEVQSPFSWDRGYDIVLEVSDDTPQEPQFKPFDKVLVRSEETGYNKWQAAFYSHFVIDKGDGYHVTTAGDFYLDGEIIPYAGNEHLVGTDKPKEE